MQIRFLDDDPGFIYRDDVRASDHPPKWDCPLCKMGIPVTEERTMAPKEVQCIYCGYWNRHDRDTCKKCNSEMVVKPEPERPYSTMTEAVQGHLGSYITETDDDD